MNPNVGCFVADMTEPTRDNACVYRSWTAWITVNRSADSVVWLYRSTVDASAGSDAMARSIRMDKDVLDSG